MTVNEAYLAIFLFAAASARTDQCPLYMTVHAALLHRQTRALVRFADVGTQLLLLLVVVVVVVDSI